MDDRPIDSLLEALREYPGLARKRGTGAWARPFVARARARPGVYGPGDDAGAMAIDGGYLLLAGEGIWAPLLEDPEFAGFCAVTVNVNDIYAMGGRPLALVAVVFEGDMPGKTRDAFLEGVTRALDHYDVQLLGGHTSPEGEEPAIAVCIVGTAEKLLRGDGARPGESIVAALDLEGEAHPRFHAWDTVTSADSARTLSRLDTLVEIAGQGLCSACRDISNPGLLGTLAMMMESSRTGAEVDLDSLPVPPAVSMEWWLKAYPSFGFLLAAPPANVEELLSLLDSRGIDNAVIGEVREGSRLEVRRQGESALFLDWKKDPVTGL
jgi:selenophosphate synthetase-related protein